MGVSGSAQNFAGSLNDDETCGFRNCRTRSLRDIKATLELHTVHLLTAQNDYLLLVYK
jgi:hypothetical protein